MPLQLLQATALVSNATTAAIVTASFTPPSGSLIVLALAANTPNTTEDGTFATPTNTGTAITWTRQVRKNVNAASTGGVGQPGGAEIWTGLGNGSAITVSANAGASRTGGYDKMMQALVYTGFNASTFNVAAASSGTGIPSLSLTGCLAGSDIVAVSSDWAAIGNGDALASQTMLNQYHNATQVSLHEWHMTTPLMSSGTVTVGMTIPTGQNWNLVAMEVRTDSLPVVGEGAANHSDMVSMIGDK